MLDHAGQVNGRFDARVAAADDRHVLALEQRAVAVRAVRHALGLVFLLARHVDVAPARAGGEDDGAALQRAAVVELHRDEATRFRRGHQFGHALRVHDVHLVVAHVLLQRGGVGGAVGFGHAGVVGDFHGVVDLAAKALGHHAGADALACCINRSRRASGAAADDQHFIRRLGRELGGVALRGAGVHLLDDLFHAHAAVGEELAVQEHGGHAHDLARLDLVLVQAAVDDRRLDARVVNGHERQRLHHVRAVVARQAHVDLEVEVGVQRLDLLQHIGFDLGRMAASPQQGQDQAGEFMPAGDGGKAQLRAAARARDGERGLASVVAVGAQRDHVRPRGDHFVQQLAQFGGRRAVVQRSHQLERLLHALEVGGQLLLDVVVQHGDYSCFGSCSRLSVKRQRLI